MEPKFKNLFSNILVFAIGNVLTKLVLFFLMPVYTSAMSTNEYGTGELIYSTVELMLPVVTLCLYEAVFRFSIDSDSNHTQLLSNALAAILKIFSGIILVALVIGFFVQIAYMWYFLLILFSWGIRQLFAQFARGIGKTKIFAASGVLQALSLCSFNIIFLMVLHWGINGYLLSIILSNLVSIVFLIVAVRIPRYIHFGKKDTYQLKAMLAFSIPMIPSTLSWWFVNISARYILVWFCGAGVAGLFTAASKLPSVVHLMSTIFQQAWQFASSKEMENKGGNRFFSSVFKLYSPFILTATSGLVVVTPLLSVILLRGEFYQAWVYVPLLLLSAALNCYSIYFGSFYTAAKKNKMIMVSTVIGAVINVGICYFTIPIWGVYGALLASCLSYLVIVVIRVADTRKYAKIKIDWGINLLSLLLLSIQATWVSLGGMQALPLGIVLFIAVLLLNLWFYRKRIAAVFRR